MSDRERFEEWLLNVHGLTGTWNQQRNCYDEYEAHLALCSWQAALASRDKEIEELREQLTRPIPTGCDACKADRDALRAQLAERDKEIEELRAQLAKDEETFLEIKAHDDTLIHELQTQLAERDKEIVALRKEFESLHREYGVVRTALDSALASKGEGV